MRKLTVSTIYRQPAQTRSALRVPHLRLTGQWLASAGFPAGARVVVTIQQGQLLITPAQ